MVSFRPTGAKYLDLISKEKKIKEGGKNPKNIFTFFFKAILVSKNVENIEP